MLTRAGLRAFVRDRQGLFWSFFFPLFFIFIFGSLFGMSGDGRQGPRLTIGLVAPEASAVSDGLKKAFQGIFEVHEGALAAETEQLESGKRRAVVVVPIGVMQSIAGGKTVDVRVLYDPAQLQTSRAVTGIVAKIIDGIDRGITKRATVIRAVEEPLLPKAAKGRKPQGMDFLLPGILAMTIMQLGIFTAIPIIVMREKGILKRLRATPVPRTSIVGSQIAQRMVISLVQTLTILLIGMSVYKFHFVGSWPVLFGVVALGVLTFICIGAVLSAVAKTQEAGVSLVQLVNFPMMFLSGIFFPVDIMPAWARPVTNALPATYLADALRNVMVGTRSAYSLTTDLVILGLWLIGGLIVATRVFKWE